MAKPEAPLSRSQLARIMTGIAKGRVPGFGAAQNDTYTQFDNVDATHGLNIRYLIPSNFQRLLTARLSFHLGPYRTYSSLSNLVTAVESGHTHSHSHGGHVHSQLISATATIGPTMWTSAGLGKIQDSGLVSDANIANINTTTPSTDASASSGHTHSVTGTSSLGVIEGATAASVTVTFDGVDATAALGGPWSADVVELNVVRYISDLSGAFHTIALTPNGLGRIDALLRLGYYADATLL